MGLFDMFNKKQQPESEDTTSAVEATANTVMGKDSILEENANATGQPERSSAPNSGKGSIWEKYPPERRSAPNFAITEDDLGGLSVTRTKIVFSDEDQKILETLSGNERQEYVSQLIESRKYKIEYLW